MAKLIFFCGKMAAGKSTLAKELAVRERAVVLNQDALAERLFPGNTVDVGSGVRHDHGPLPGSGRGRGVQRHPPPP